MGLTLDMDMSGDVSFEEFWTWWQTVPFPKAKKKKGGVGDQGKQAPEELPTYKREELEMLSQSPGGRRSPWGAPKSPYGGSTSPTSPMMGARFAQSVKGQSPTPGQSPAMQYGDVLAGPGGNARRPPNQF